MSEETNSILLTREKFIFNPVEYLDTVDEEIFQQVLVKDRPVLLKNCSFGQCFDKWNLEYLNHKLQNDSIVIHESDYSDLNFLEKNFKYKTCKFEEFAKQLKSESLPETITKCLYLRSTNKNPRSKKPARIEDDFPIISEDLKPPSFIPFGPENELYHSSVLRIASSNLQIWTHFDLYDNVLCQIVGTKRIILFPPDDTEYLYVKGDKSLVNNLNDWKECIESFPLIKKTRPHQCFLKPGEILYIPALWWHNIKTVDDLEVESKLKTNYSIGFNIFWKDVDLFSENFYADSDVYGNRNLKPVDSAIANLDKAITHIEKLPKKYKLFYKHLLLQTFKEKLFPP